MATKEGVPESVPATEKEETREPLDESEEEATGGMFDEPEGYFKPPPQATWSTYKRSNGEEVKLKLLGSHPLWGHLLWNAGIVTSDHFEKHPELVRGKNVLELGAGSALPSIIAVKNGARKVVVTDYPDKDLMDNITENVERNTTPEERANVVNVQGHLWGTSVEPLLAPLSNDGSVKFDVIILADLIFNHSQHRQLLQTCRTALADDGLVLVTFSHHKTTRAHLDMAFFDLAEETDNGEFVMEHLFSERRQPMFEKDFGPEEMRATVHVRTLTFKKS